MGRESNQMKPHFDITLSKRTRKPLYLQEGAQKPSLPELEAPVELAEKEEEKNDDHKSLNQLIKVRSTTSLGKHLTEEQEEKKLQIVVKHDNEDGSEGVKLKKMVSRYSKILSRLIKAKRDPGSRNKPALRLTM